VRYFLRNLHILVFASICFACAVAVSLNPDRTVGLLRPVVEDAVELKELAEDAWRKARRTGWRTAADDAVSLFTASLRMPTRLFEELAEKLDRVDRDMKRARRVGAVERLPRG
jgi:hypothetical protein